VVIGTAIGWTVRGSKVCSVVGKNISVVIGTATG
jgi:hypothetical protein